MTCNYSCDEPPELEPYGDIAGLGVLIGFLVTAYFVVVVLLVYYVFIYDPYLDPFRPIADRETKVEHPNMTDEIIIGLLRKIPVLNTRRVNSHAKNDKLEAALNKCVLLFADTQIVTGIAILVSGFCTIRCGLSTYHWQLVVYLAWFSSITHLSTLSFLRHYLYNHRTEKICRASGMFAMLVLLCFALVPTAHFVWLDYKDEELPKPAVLPHHHAACYYWKAPDANENVFFSFLVSLFLLTYGYFTRLGKMSPKFTTLARNHITKLKEWEKATLRKWQSSPSRLWTQAIDSLMIAGCRCLILQVDCFTSMFAEVYWIFISTIWGTRRIFTVRRFGPGEENTWTFGQVLPLVLLAVPLLSIVEYAVEYKSSQQTIMSSLRHWPAPTAIMQSPRTFRHNTSERQNRASPNLLIYDAHYAGVLFLIFLSYVGITTFILTNTVASLTTISFTVVQLFGPLVGQLSWSIWWLWLEKLEIRATTVSYLQFLVLLAFALSLYDLQPSWAGSEQLFGMDTDLVAIIAVFDVVFSIWLGFELRSRGLEEVRDATQRRWNQYLRLLFASIFVAAGSSSYAFIWSPGKVGITLVVSFCPQLLWVVFQERLAWSSVSESRRQQIQIVVFVLVLILIMVSAWVPYKFSFNPALQILSFSLLSIVCCISRMLWIVMQRRWG